MLRLYRLRDFLVIDLSVFTFPTSSTIPCSESSLFYDYGNKILSAERFRDKFNCGH